MHAQQVGSIAQNEEAALMSTIKIKMRAISISSALILARKCGLLYLAERSIGIIHERVRACNMGSATGRACLMGFGRTSPKWIIDRTVANPRGHRVQ
jgi:hypothetical protein